MSADCVNRCCIGVNILTVSKTLAYLRQSVSKSQKCFIALFPELGFCEVAFRCRNPSMTTTYRQRHKTSLLRRRRSDKISWNVCPRQVFFWLVLYLQVQLRATHRVWSSTVLHLGLITHKY